MVYPLLLGSTLLRTTRTTVPRISCRHKSITAAIERGRRSGFDRPSRSSPRAAFGDGGGGEVKNRRQQRLERFGPPRDDSKTTREERPQIDHATTRHEHGAIRHEKRLMSRDRLDLKGRQFSQPRPRPEDRLASRPESEVDRDRRTDGERKPASDHFAGERKPFPGRASSSEPRRERFEARDGPASRPDRSSYAQDSKPFNVGNRADKSRNPYFDRAVSRESRSDEGNRFDKPRPPYSDRAVSRGSRREGFEYGQKDLRPERPPRRDDGESSHAPRPRGNTSELHGETRFSHRPDSKGARREHSGRERTERYYTHESSQKQLDSPSDTRADVHAPKNSPRGPRSLSYTTAASEFIYGYSSVLAAIKAKRRQLYKLYVHSRGANRDGLMARTNALNMFLITKEVGDHFLPAMDKASGGRPHNGVILESSPLPVSPITELKAASISDQSFSVALDSQSMEDAAINGEQELYRYKSGGWRQPLILYVDGVLDEGNLGATARSAYFLGVDAIVTPTRQTAPWSHIALKASAGAAEAIPLFKVGDPVEFLGRSSRAGWRIYASDAVPPAPSISSSTSTSQDDEAGKVVYTIARSTKRLPADHCPVGEHPTILMMGAESTGLRDSLQNLAHYKVGIPHGREVDEIGVDSLNVSVAASLLCYEMLQKPRSKLVRNPEEALF